MQDTAGEARSNSGDVLQWVFTGWPACASRSARTCLNQVCADTGYSLEELPETMDERDGWK